MTLVIHAINVHQGGGAILLYELLNVIPPGISVVALIDGRMKLPKVLRGRIFIKRIQPTFFSRLMAEFWLLKNVDINDKVLCFGSLPPLFRVRGDVSVFLQNRYLVDERASLCLFPLKSRMRLQIERAWLAMCCSHAKRYFVQTPSMQQLAEDRLGMSAVCVPFVPENVLASATTPARSSSARFDFLYVASGESHKNHVTLISAWALLADEGLFPSLALTLSETISPRLVKQIEAECKTKGLRVHNLGVLPHDQLVCLYKDSKALIYPSGLESFGLPLIEAKLAGLPVLASELDFVRDILDPAESFDPSSPVSISRAVKRFLNKKPSTFRPIDAKSFLNNLMGGGLS